jgi:signal transduction histidine kinase
MNLPKFLKGSTHLDEAHIWINKFNRKRLLFVSALTVFALLSSVMLYTKIKDKQIAQLRALHEEQITLAVIDINRELGDIRNTLRLLSTDTEILSGLSLFNTLNQRRLKNVFNQFGNAVDHLLQVRWLDAKGHEKVRVNINNGVTQVVPNRDLQDKSHRYYFKNAMEVFPPEIYISPIDLNIENGQIIKPFQPVFRIGFQTTERYGMRHGLLMINYDLTTLIEKIRVLSTPESEVMLVDAWGNWLLHPDKAQEWGSALQQPENNLKHKAPLLWEYVQKEKNNILEPFDGELISARLISLSNEDFPAVAESIYMITRTPTDKVTEIEWSAAKPALVVMICIMLIGGKILFRDFAMQKNLKTLTQTLAREKHELKQLNRELDSALSQQQLLQNELVETRKLSSLGMMVAGVAHELNTPVGGALISTSSLQSFQRSLKQSIDDGLTRQALDDYVEHTEEGLALVENNLKRAAALIKSFKRLALDRANEEVVQFNLDQVVSDLLCTLTPKLKNSGTHVVNKTNSDLVLTGYPGIVSQILQNLIINAITYGTEGMQQGEITLQTELSEEWVVLSVSDNGKGVSPELKECLFDPFVTSGRGIGHTGLGLHLVHQWVTQLMHGQIKMESPPEGGTRFVIHLPIKIAASKGLNTGNNG